MTDCYPILGGTSIEQLKSNIEALKIVLTPEQLKKLNDASPFDHGFPTQRFGLDPRLLPNQEPQHNMITTVRVSNFPMGNRLTVAGWSGQISRVAIKPPGWTSDLM